MTLKDLNQEKDEKSLKKHKEELERKNDKLGQIIGSLYGERSGWLNSSSRSMNLKNM